MILEINVRSISEYIDAADAAVVEAQGRVAWFRGVNNVNHLLRPSLYRHPTIGDLPNLRLVERRLVNHFRERAIVYTKNEVPDDDWNLLFVMQHFGVPTRLLDWSENALVALWFALKQASTPTPPGGDACVWILDPFALNRLTFDFDPPVSIFSVSDTMLDDYGPAGDLKNQKPVALFGAHNNPRIVAQRGAFTIAGSDVDGFVNTDWLPSGVLRRATIASADVATMSAALTRLGFTETMIFPELAALARELGAGEGY